MSTNETDSNKYWSFECANCQCPITIKPDDQRPILVSGETFTLHCGECGFDGEYLHADISILSISDKKGGEK